MPEIIDEANALEQHIIDIGISKLRINRNAVSATHCEECGIEIPEARRISVPGCTMCIDCKEIAERKSKVGGL